MNTLTREQQKDIGEMTNILIILQEEDREILMSNARAFKARNALVEANKKKTG